MAHLSCIIPVLGTTDGLEHTLLSVLENCPADCEILVVLNTPYDDPYALAGEIQFIAAPSTAGLVSCANLGLAAATGEIVHLLASGMAVGPGWAEPAVEHFSDPLVAAVTPIVFDAADPVRPLTIGVGYERGGRRKLCQSLAAAERWPLASVGPTLDAAFYRKAAIDATGGGLTHLVGDELVDIDLALTLAAGGWKLVIEFESRVYAAGTLTFGEGSFRAGLHQERMFWRHARELGLIAGLAAHVPAAIKDLLTRPWWTLPAQLAGRLTGACRLGDLRQYRESLALCRLEAAVARGGLADEAATSAAAEQRRLDPPHARGANLRTSPLSASAKSARATR